MTIVTHTRKPLTAFLLSLPAPGLGQIYCGQLAKGLVLFFLSFAFVPVLVVMALATGPGRLLMTVAIATILFRVGVSLYAMIAAVVSARRIGSHYELKEYNTWYLYLLLAVVSMVGSITLDMDIRDHVVQAFKVPSGSMLPSIYPAEAVLVNKGIYSVRSVQVGDVVVFVYPNNRSIYFMKRVVGLPGDTLEMKDNILYRNGKPYDYKPEALKAALQDDLITGSVLTESTASNSYLILLKGHSKGLSDFSEMIVPNGHCFVLGDNRNHSKDSRQFGPVPLFDILGRVDFIHLPKKSLTRFGWFPKE